MRRAALVTLAALSGACSRAPVAPPVAASSPGAAPAAAPARGFRDVTRDSGIAFVHQAARSEHRWLPETMGSGVAVLDFDGDGRMDLYFVDGGTMTTDGAGPAIGTNKLYRNLGGWHFEDVTTRAGVPGRAGGMGAAAGDLDRDGDTDLLVTGYRSTLLYLNEGDGTFRDATEASGIADGGWTTGAAFFDADADGHLDLFLQRYARWNVALHRPCRQAGIEVYCTPDLLEPDPSRLLRGRGNGTFEDVSAASGVGAHPGKGLGVVTGDLDGDGDVDIYCANDTFRNFLFENRGGMRFEEMGLLSGSAYGADGREEAGMGADAADLDGDGLLDLVVANFENEPVDLYRNEGGLSFTEVSALSGVAALSRNRLKFGIRAVDVDLDGWTDVAVANGHVWDNAAQVAAPSTHPQPGLLLRNRGAGQFEDATGTLGGDLATSRVGRGLASADLDDDGDIDFVLTQNGGPPALLQNAGTPAGAWLGVRCVGTKRDATALGARVSVTAAGRTQVQEVRSGASYLSQSDLRLVFGLPGAARADSVVVTWPGGAKQELRDVATGVYVTLTEE